MKRGLHIAVFLLLTCLGVAEASAEKRLDFVVLKDGEPIGSETVNIKSSNGRIVVDVKTETHVRVLFLKFDYFHQRREVWQGDQLISVVSKTNDNGSEHNYKMMLEKGQFLLEQDGNAKHLPKDHFPLSLWGKSVLNRDVLLSVIDAEPFKVTTKQLGENHYQIDGGVTRELWFSEDGFLKKVAFERRGYNIEFVRN